MKLLIPAVGAVCLALLAACGGGTATNDAAGTLTEAKQSTAEPKQATAEQAPAANDEAAAAEAANTAVEGDAASAAKANGKNGKVANGLILCGTPTSHC